MKRAEKWLKSLLLYPDLHFLGNQVQWPSKGLECRLRAFFLEIPFCIEISFDTLEQISFEMLCQKLRGTGGNHFPQRVPRAEPLAVGDNYKGTLL